MSRQPDRTATAAMKAPPPNTSPGLFTNGAAPAPKPQVATPPKPQADPPASNEVKCGNVNRALGICCRNEHPPDEMHQCTGGERWTTEQAAALDAPPKAVTPLPVAHAVDPAAPVAVVDVPQKAIVAQPVPAPAPAPPPPVAPAKPAPVQPKPVVPPVRAAVPQQPAGPPKRMALPSADAVDVDEAWRAFIVGVGGIGKTTFGVQSDRPVFLSAEHSPNVPARMRGPRPENWEDFFVFCRQLENDKHDFGTLVVDTVNAMLPFIADEVIDKAKSGAGNSKGKVNYLSDLNGGYGDAGVKSIDEELVRFLALMDRLRSKRGMNIILTSHCDDGMVKILDAGVRIEQYVPALPDALWKRIQGWSDITALARRQVVVEGVGRKALAKRIAPMHLLRLRPTPSSLWVKSRWPMPDEIPLSYDEFAAQLRGRTAAEIAMAEQSIRDLAAQLEGNTFVDRDGKENTFATWAEGVLAERPKADKLLQIENRLRVKLAALAPDEPAEGDETTQ